MPYGQCGLLARNYETAVVRRSGANIVFKRIQKLRGKAEDLHIAFYVVGLGKPS